MTLVYITDLLEPSSATKLRGGRGGCQRLLLRKHPATILWIHEMAVCG